MTNESDCGAEPFMHYTQVGYSRKTSNVLRSPRSQPLRCRLECVMHPLVSTTCRKHECKNSWTCSFGFLGLAMHWKACVSKTKRAKPAVVCLGSAILSVTPLIAVAVLRPFLVHYKTASRFSLSLSLSPFLLPPLASSLFPRLSWRKKTEEKQILIRPLSFRCCLRLIARCDGALQRPHRAPLWLTPFSTLCSLEPSRRPTLP